METASSVNDSTAVVANTIPLAASIWQDVLAQAITGELIASMNYRSLAEICVDEEEKAEALEHAANERGHAAAFANEGRKLGVVPIDNVEGQYWKRLRAAFMRCIAERDFVGCLIIQEVMLESFAVASYARIGKVGPGSLGETFAAIAAEEEEHVDHAMAILRADRALDVEKFDSKVHRIHLDVMTTLAEMLAREDKNGHCEVCHGNCMKTSLPGIGLTTSELRGASLQQYLTTLDMLGLPGETTLEWVTKLPV
jgi:fatty aldehyde decarbonylase